MAESESNQPTAPESEASPQVTVEEAGPARKKISIEIPESQIQGKLDEQFNHLKEEAALPGFRRGKVPARLLERRFGKDLRQQVKGELLNEAYQQAMQEKELSPLGDPEIETDQIELPESGPLSFSFEVDVQPEVELPDFSGLTVDKPSASVSDDEVEQEIESYQERFGQHESIEDAEVRESDFVQGDVRILAGEDAGDDAEELEQHPGTYAIVHGEDFDYKGHLAGIVIPDFGKRLLGKQVGDVERFSVTGPESHENERIANQPITITLRIDQVQRVVPAPVETVMEQAGMESADELRQQVRQMLEGRRQRDQQQEMHRQVREQLRERVEVELPENILERQKEQALRQRQMQAMYRGESPEAEPSEETRAEVDREARNELKDLFVLGEAAKQLEVSVSENEVNQQVTMAAMQQGQRPEQFRKQLEERGELQSLYMDLREHKTLDAILEQATVNEPEGEGEAGDANESSEESQS